MRVTRVAHVSVNVEGALDATADFYGEILGLDTTARPEIPGVDGRWLLAGDTEVHLVDAPMRGRGIDPTGPHFCVFVEDLDAAIAELEDRGIEYRRGAQGDVVQIWIADPSGHTVELQQER
jgi:catechol 2,3-dioxygenase-like lactoylglutathione lyase family enzyme